MKKFFVSFVAMLAMAVSFVSCSDDVEDVITADFLVGNYKGTANVSINMGEGKEPKIVGRYTTTATITTIKENNIKIAISGFGSGYYILPSFEIPLCKVDGVNEKTALLFGSDFGFYNNGEFYAAAMHGLYGKGEVQLNLLVNSDALPSAINVIIYLKK